MRKIDYFIVDVFAENKYSGNQLAVFLCGNKLTAAEMQTIAKEINFSESTFIISEGPQKAAYDVRIFTPEHEVPFAGHPTLGTAHIIRNHIADGAPEKIHLNFEVGQIPVTLSYTGENAVYWMKQMEPVFMEVFPIEKLAPVLGLPEEDFDGRFPIEEVTTGFDHIIVPLKNLNALKKAKADRDRYFELINNTRAKNIMIFSPEPHLPQNDISVRMFSYYLGIPEDPATGSGNGCLAGYLVKHRYYGSSRLDLKSEQGYEIGRPSLLYLRAEDINGKIDVYVGGSAVTVARGEWYI